LSLSLSLSPILFHLHLTHTAVRTLSLHNVSTAHLYLRAIAPRSANIIENEYLPRSLPGVFRALEEMRAARHGSKHIPFLPTPTTVY
jgi:hypothetical protein